MGLGKKIALALLGLALAATAYMVVRAQIGYPDPPSLIEPRYVPPVTAAVFSDDPAELERVLDGGADIDEQDEHGFTPLMALLIFGIHSDAEREMLGILLAHGADVSLRDRFGQTPLHPAARDLDLKSITALLAAGADVNARDHDRHTPLHNAARSIAKPRPCDPVVVFVDEQTEQVDYVAGYRNVLQALVDAGADLAACNRKSQRPYDFMRDADHELAPLLDPYHRH